MGEKLMTPLGEIQIFIDGIYSDYYYEKYGMEYVRKAPADKVMFGVAWRSDYEENPDDIRTKLVTDLY